MLKTITLLGTSLGDNAGDAALISSIMESVDRACGSNFQYEIPTITPQFVRQTYGHNAIPVSMLPWKLSLNMLGLPTYQSIMRTDMTMVFDAILFDRRLYNPLVNYLSTLYLLLPLAKERGKKLAFFNVTAGPVKTPRGKEMLRRLADMMEFVTLRDRESFEIMRSIGVRKDRMLLAADAGLNVSAAGEERIQEIYSQLGLDPKNEILALNINSEMDTWCELKRTPAGKERFLQIYAAALNEVLAKLKVPVLFICSFCRDLRITKALISRLKSNQPIAVATYRQFDHHELKGLLSKTSLLFGMRLSALIMASSSLVPVCGLTCRPKSEHYLSTLGLGQYSMRFSNFAVGTLTEHILGAWQGRNKIKEILVQRIPELQSEAYRAAELVAAIHRGESLDPYFARYRELAKTSSSGIYQTLR